MYLFSFNVHHIYICLLYDNMHLRTQASSKCIGFVCSHLTGFFRSVYTQTPKNYFHPIKKTQIYTYVHAYIHTYIGI